jgi:phosphoribosylaminoimidazole (AIR) synthetase
MLDDEGGVGGEEMRVEEALDAGEVDAAVLGVRVVAVDEEDVSGEEGGEQEGECAVGLEAWGWHGLGLV